MQAVAERIEEVLPSSPEARKQPRPQDVLNAILDLDLKQVHANLFIHSYFIFVCNRTHRVAVTFPLIHLLHLLLYLSGRCPMLT